MVYPYFHGHIVFPGLICYNRIYSETNNYSRLVQQTQFCPTVQGNPQHYRFSATMNSKVTYWVDLSEYDIATAEAMLESKRYLYVGFMAHQSIEKIFKAYFVGISGETAPYTHSLSFLAKKSDLYQYFSEEQQNFIDMLEPMNIEARYPINKKKLLDALTEERCASILHKAKELRKWILLKL